MKNDKINFDDIAAEEKRRFVLLKKLLIDLEQTLSTFSELERLNSIIKMGTIGEMAVKGFLVILEVDFKDHVPFNELIGDKYLAKEYRNKFDSGLPYRIDLRNMYIQRNQAQHGGILPDKSDLQRWMSKIKRFVNKVFNNIFDVKFEEIDLSYLILNDERRELFQEIDDLINKEEWHKAIRKCSTTYDELIERYFQNHYNHLFTFYTDYKDDIKLFNTIEKLAKRDIYGILNISNFNEWKYLEKYFECRDDEQLMLDTFKPLINQMRETIMELILKLDTIEEAHHFQQRHILLDFIEIPMQYGKATGILENKKFEMILSGIISESRHLKILQQSYDNQEGVFLELPYIEDFSCNVKITHFELQYFGIVPYQRFFAILEGIKRENNSTKK